MSKNKLKVASDDTSLRTLAVNMQSAGDCSAQFVIHIFKRKLFQTANIARRRSNANHKVFMRNIALFYASVELLSNKKIKPQDPKRKGF